MSVGTKKIKEEIIIEGAEMHNLKNISLKIPKKKLIVITGLSGSFYIIASHEDGWTDYEGFGVDASVDYPDNMYTYYYGIWKWKW